MTRIEAERDLGCVKTLFVVILCASEAHGMWTIVQKHRYHIKIVSVIARMRTNNGYAT